MSSKDWKSEFPAWDDPVLDVNSDTKWVARYRRLQSWYREVVMDAPPGSDHYAMRGNLLDEAWSREHPGANFLDDEIAEYVESRLIEVQQLKGTMEEGRLRRNLMSSQPLCFNMFGKLRAHMDEAAAPLSKAFGLDMAKIEQIEVEAPYDYLGDRTAFDAYIEYTTSDGRRGFVGVETKYTETFSDKEIDKPRYREVTDWPDSGFKAGAADELVKSKTNQLWRNALLVVAHRSEAVAGLEPAKGFDLGHVAVVHCEGDAKLDVAIGLFREQLADEESLLRVVSYERLVDVLESVAPFEAWASEFRRRYLDLG